MAGEGVNMLTPENIVEGGSSSNEDTTLGSLLVGMGYGAKADVGDGTRPFPSVGGGLGYSLLSLPCIFPPVRLNRLDGPLS